ncbi:hypothetical protein [Rhodococcus globerulus]|uniref:hypothetical protein n=1 Tax=Rhodococcus globerulus TaxID=33008 RepID=UPI001C5A5922|nr:hypothetical protein [Rhodococcus globerulus]QXW01347.1 hypothetical protein KYT97_23880 [Rhodococcus globerulus]
MTVTVTPIDSAIFEKWSYGSSDSNLNMRFFESEEGSSLPLFGGVFVVHTPSGAPLTPSESKRDEVKYLISGTLTLIDLKNDDSVTLNAGTAFGISAGSHLQYLSPDGAVVLFAMAGKPDNPPFFNVDTVSTPKSTNITLQETPWSTK